MRFRHCVLRSPVSIFQRKSIFPALVLCTSWAYTGCGGSETPATPAAPGVQKAADIPVPAIPPVVVCQNLHDSDPTDLPSIIGTPSQAAQFNADPQVLAAKSKELVSKINDFSRITRGTSVSFRTENIFSALDAMNKLTAIQNNPALLGRWYNEIVFAVVRSGSRNRDQILINFSTSADEVKNILLSQPGAFEKQNIDQEFRIDSQRILVFTEGLETDSSRLTLSETIPAVLKFKSMARGMNFRAKGIINAELTPNENCYGPQGRFVRLNYNQSSTDAQNFINQLPAHEDTINQETALANLRDEFQFFSNYLVEFDDTVTLAQSIDILHKLVANETNPSILRRSLAKIRFTNDISGFEYDYSRFFPRPFPGRIDPALMVHLGRLTTAGELKVGVDSLNLDQLIATLAAETNLEEASTMINSMIHSLIDIEAHGSIIVQSEVSLRELNAILPTLHTFLPNKNQLSPSLEGILVTRQSSGFKNGLLAINAQANKTAIETFLNSLPNIYVNLNPPILNKDIPEYNLRVVFGAGNNAANKASIRNLFPNVKDFQEHDAH